MVRLMKSKFLISTKSSGLCFNIMRLIILTDIAKEYKRDLIFLTKPDHIPILKLFNTNCTFIPYIKNHTDLFNNYKRQRSIHKVYDLKYTKFVLDTYLRNLFNDSAINNVKFVCGNRYDLNDSDHKFLLIDYNDGTHDAEILNSIKSKKFVFSRNNSTVDQSIITINIKINNSENRRIFDFWDEIIPKLKNYNKPICLISGNNNIKHYLAEKHKCNYDLTASETNYSNVRGNDITRGKPFAVFNDVLTCSLSHFIPFTQLRVDYPDIMNNYTDLNFVTEKVEKFDILTEYISKYKDIIEESQIPFQMCNS